MTETNDKAGTEVFAPRRAFSLLLIPALVTLLFVAAGIAARIITRDSSTLIISFAVLPFFAIVFVSAAAIGFSYKIENGDLVLKNAFSRTRISLRDVSMAYLLDQKRAQAFLTDLETPWAMATRNRDFSPWGRAVKRNSGILRYMSVPLVTSSRSVGSKTNITDFRAMARGEYILVETVDGAARMLTPKDAEGLYRRLLAAGARPGNPDKPVAAERERLEREEEGRKDRFSGRFVRTYRIASFALVAFVVGAVVFGLFRESGRTVPGGTSDTVSPAADEDTLASGNTGANAAGDGLAEGSLPAERPAAGWTDGNTLRVWVDSMYWPREDQPRDDRISQMREFGDLEAESAFANYVSEEYAARNGIAPEDMKWDQGVKALKDWAAELPKTRIYEDLGDRLRFGKFVYEYSSPGLKAEAERRFAAFR